MAIAATGTEYIDSLLLGSSWTGDAGQSASISYTIAAEESSSFPGLYVVNSNYKAAVQSVLARFSEIANVTFNYHKAEVISSTTERQLTFYLSDIGEDILGLASFVGVSGTIDDDIFLGATKIDKVDVDISDTLHDIGDFFSSEDLAQGEIGYVTVLHEIGHALGLDHPEDGGIFDGDATLDMDLDGTVMNAVAETFGINTLISGQPMGPQIYDIAALQYLYGANTSYNSGDTGYTYSAAPRSFTIWDGGGVDAINQSASSISTVIDLREGVDYVSHIGYARIWIAFGANIENALGGSSADTIQGNSLANSLFGRGGNDTVAGYAGNDEIRGGAGNDLLRGGAGNDRILGGKGDDVFYGGAGNDTFVMGASSSGDDLIYNFNAAADVIEIPSEIFANAAAAISASSVSGGNMVIDLGGGNSLTLVGITTTLVSDDFSIT